MLTQNIAIKLNTQRMLTQNIFLKDNTVNIGQFSKFTTCTMVNEIKKEKTILD